ncbi:hypothetical protein SEA_CAIB_69 [Gordonia phage CaiB]|nr:hypothetical protein SEA_CAIB_69 [Gordonia phage CaiB]
MISTDPAAPSDAVPVARPVEARPLKTSALLGVVGAPSGVDLGGALGQGALISGGFTPADTEPFPGPTLSTAQQRTLSVTVRWSEMSAEGYRVLMGHHFARHDLDARAGRGLPCRTLETIKALLALGRWPHPRQ